MQLFKKRESLTQNIAYMGIMTAINVVAVVLMNYVLPALFIPFMLVLPFASTVVTLYCKKIYFPFYLFATVGICLLVTINNISDTLFYILPSILTGFLFGIALTYRLPIILAIVATALVNVGLTYLSIPIIQGIYGQNMIQVIAKIFGLDTFVYLDFIVPAFIMAISLIQETVTYFFIDAELPKLGVHNEENQSMVIGDIIGIIASAMVLICYVTRPAFFSTFALFFIILPIVFAVYDIALLAFKKDFGALIINGIFFLSFVVLFALTYSNIEKPFGIIMLAVYLDFVLIFHLIYRLFLIKNKAETAP